MLSSSVESLLRVLLYYCAVVLLVLLPPAPRAQNVPRHHSSALDKFQNSFWSRQFRPLAAGEDSSKVAGAANDRQAHPSSPGGTVAPLDHDAERPRYGRDDHYEALDDIGRPHYSYDDSQPAYGDWPECRGTCGNGKCHLEKHYSGCCYLADASGDDQYPEADYEEAKAANVGDVNKDAVPLNVEGKRGMRVCW
jgi:hypothetical protein